MRKLLNNPWIVAALALAAVAFVGVSLWPKSPAPDRIATAAVNPSVVVEPSEPQAFLRDASPLSVQDALKVIALTSMPTDPFASSIKHIDGVVTERIALPDVVETMKLSAIWSQDGKSFVLVNGQVHQPGDQISRITIESATQEGMWVGHWKGRSFVTLGTDFTLVTPAKAEQRTARL